MACLQIDLRIYATMVGEYFNKIKTTFDFKFD